MKTITWNGIMLTAILLLGGCESSKISTRPTPASGQKTTNDWFRTSRVNPEDFEDSDLEGLTLDHDPWAPGVQMCRTKQREYCSPDGLLCNWEVDYYTVMAPKQCPAEPID